MSKNYSVPYSLIVVFLATASLLTNCTSYEETPEKKKIQEIRITPANPNLTVGNTVILTASAYDNMGNPLSVSSEGISWSSDNTAIADVDKNGLVTGVSEGSAKITATQTESLISKSVTINVKYDIAYLHVTPDVQEIKIGDIVQLSVSAYDTVGNKLPLSADRFSWTSSDTSIATVDTNGLITGVAGGLIKISVQESSSLITESKTIIVKYDFCGKDLSNDEFIEFLNGNLVIAGTYKDKGSSSSDIIKGLIEAIVLNGIDLTRLSEYNLSFNDGVYKASRDGSGISFKLYFAKDFGTYHTGDLIPYNLFDIETFIANIKISVSLNGVSYNYDHGPLYDLINGEIKLSGLDINGLDFNFKLKNDYIAFLVNSKETYYGESPRDEDTLTLSMTTSLAPLDNIHEQFYTGGFGISYDGTVYDSTYYGIKQDFYDSVFLMTSDETGWFWEGDYKSKVEKDKDIYYQKGFVSNRSQNYTEYYCDESLMAESKVGVAKHNLDLKGGVFTFSDGAEVKYGLGEF